MAAKECQRRGCRKAIGPRRTKYCSSYCAQREHRWIQRKGKCVDCGEAIAKRSVRCSYCSHERLSAMFQDRPFAEETKAKMRRTQQARQDALRGFAVTPELIAAWRERILAGARVCELAKEVGIGDSSMSVLLRYGSWQAYRRRYMGEVEEWKIPNRKQTARGAVRLKLTNDDVKAIIQRVQGGKRGILKKVAAEFGVSANYVGEIVAGKHRAGDLTA